MQPHTKLWAVNPGLAMELLLNDAMEALNTANTISHVKNMLLICLLQIVADRKGNLEKLTKKCKGKLNLEDVEWHIWTNVVL